MPNDLIDILLSKRGITDPEERRKFLNPSYENGLHDPFLMRDMEKATVRVFEAMEAKEKIVIYSDYDCDGIPGAVILSDLLDICGYTNYEVYIPDRHDEGYGLHKDAVESFIKDGVTLIITIDLGISAHEEVLLANSKGVDVIITDHHLCAGDAPEAFAILNPKIDEYPYKMLCGSGVVFKFVQGFLFKYREFYKIKEGWEKWMLDMAGLATLSDMVPLLGENRTIAYFGIQVLRKSKRLGFRELLKTIKLDQGALTEDDIAFSVTPKINAASRLDTPRLSFELLKTKDPVRAKELATKLSSINDERKILVALAVKEAKKKLKAKDIGNSIVIGDPSWRPGILGLVASKILDEHKIPVFVWGSDGEGLIKGSCRSGSIGVLDIMTGAKEALVEYGGHHGAGGFATTKDLLHDLPMRIEESVKEILEKGIPDVETESDPQDAIVDLSNVSRRTYNNIDILSPFGFENPKPIFLFSGVTVVNVKHFGKMKDHLELTLRDEYGESVAIAFFKTSDSYNFKLENGVKLDLYGTLDLSNFRGYANIRIRIVDLCLSK